MKRILLISTLLLAACAPMSKAPLAGEEDGEDKSGEERTVSIAYLKTLYKGAPVRVAEEIIVAGRVVSSDVKGNFYKTLVIDDPTGGIELRIDLEQVFKHFMVHTRVVVRCNGLWLGSYGGTLQLGTEPYEGWQTQHIPESEIPLHIQTDEEFNAEVLPHRLGFDEIAPEYIATFVSFDGVQFADEEAGMSWAEVDSETDTDRHLVDLRGDTLVVRTSRYALFAHKTLPDGNGYIEGVLNHFNGKYQLVVCDDMKAVMDEPRF